MTFLRASIALVGATASAKEAGGPSLKSPQKLRGLQAPAQQGEGRDRELVFDGDGGLEGLFGEGGIGDLEDLFGAFGGTTGSGGLDGSDVGLSGVLEDVVDGLADAFNATGGDSVLTQIVDSFAEAVDGLADTLQEGMLQDGMSGWNFTVVDWGDGAVWSGTDAESGASVLGQVAGSFACPATCANEELCATIFTGMADPPVLEEACNAGCLPSPASCADVCGTAADGAAAGLLPSAPTAVTRFIDLEAVTSLACDSCKFLACCGADPVPGGDDATGGKFASCQEHLPDGNALWADVSNIGIGADEVQGWVAEIAEGLGLSDVFDGDLPSLLGDALAVIDAFPATCDRDSCPIDGLCDASVLDLAALDFDDLCVKDAFFGCSEGLKGMCEDECGAGGDGDDLESKAPLCTLCGVATCCASSEVQEKTFRDCALGALPENLAGLLGGAASALGSVPADEEAASTVDLRSVPAAEEATSTADASTDTNNNGGAPVTPTETGQADASAPSSGSADPGPAAEASRAEGNDDGVTVVTAAASAVQDSASRRLGTAAAGCLALTSVAALFLASS